MMSSQEHYIHPQTLLEIVLLKRRKVAELQEQCPEQKIIATSETTIGDLNSQYLALKAENEVLKTCNPNVIPKCKTLLFAWAHQKLQEDVKNLELLLSFQKNMKKITIEKELELRNLCQKESHQSLNPCLKLEELREIENLRSDILCCLHQKLIRRLRRITREYFSAFANNELQAGDNLNRNKKSLFSILQVLLPELKDNSLKPDEWERLNGINLKSSYPKEYVKLLLNSQIVNIDKEKPNFMKIAC